MSHVNPQEKIKHLEKIIYELEQNLLCAQDQNHYLKLCEEWRDKYYTLKKEYDELKFRMDGLEK